MPRKTTTTATTATTATPTTDVLDVLASLDAALPASATGAKTADDKITLRQAMAPAAVEIIAQANAAGRTGLRAATVTRDLSDSVVRQAAQALRDLAQSIADHADQLDADQLVVWAKTNAGGTRTGETRVTTSVQPGRTDGVWANANLSVTLEGTLSRALAKHAGVKAAGRKSQSTGQ